MMTIVMSVCSVLSAHCKEVELVFADLTLVQCQMGIGSQVEMAKWTAGHPNWIIAKWRCRPAGTVAKI